LANNGCGGQGNEPIAAGPWARPAAFEIRRIAVDRNSTITKVSKLGPVADVFRRKQPERFLATGSLCVTGSSSAMVQVAHSRDEALPEDKEEPSRSRIGGALAFNLDRWAA